MVGPKNHKQQFGSVRVLQAPLAQRRHKARRAGNRIIMYDPSSKDKENFMKECALYAPINPLDGAISVIIEFSMPRPKSHYRTGKYSHILKDSMPTYHTSKPDIDNLIKFYLDAMTGLYWRDDAIVYDVHATKIYSDKGMVEIEYWKA